MPKRDSTGLIKHWPAASALERANSQASLLDLCDLLEVPAPDSHPAAVSEIPETLWAMGLAHRVRANGPSAATVFKAGSAHRKSTWLSSPAKATHEIDDQADEENQANSAATDCGTAKVKPAAPEHQEQDNQN